MIQAFAFVMGAIFGSFLNVCIYRMPKNESIVFPGSRCMKCQKPIAAYDNIPILSYLILRGKCRHCGAHFSAQYMVVEILTGLIFMLFYSVFGFTPIGFIYLAFALALIVQAFIDFEHRIIPDEITLYGIAAGLIASSLHPALHHEEIWWRGFLQSLIGVLIGGGFLYLSAILAEWFFKQEAMGGGDIKLLAMIGAFLGWKGVLWTIFVSSLFGSIIGMYQKIRYGQQTIPYGPYLGLAAFLYLFIGTGVYGWYLGLFKA